MSSPWQPARWWHWTLLVLGGLVAFVLLLLLSSYLTWRFNRFSVWLWS